MFQRKEETQQWEVIYATDNMDLYFKAQNLLRDHAIRFETRANNSFFRGHFFRTSGNGGDTYQLAVKACDVAIARSALQSLTIPK